MLATNTLLSGNNFAKVCLLAKFMKLPVPSKSFYTRVQGLYAIPDIISYWDDIQAEVINSIKHQSLVLSGDARNDSPGYSAKFCTYTLMTHDNSDIVSIVTVDKRHAALKSPNMEKLALEKSLAAVCDMGVSVQKLVTDAHTQITAYLREEHSEIQHQWDVWHGAKNLNKKLQAVASKSGCSDLKLWVPDVVKHFWHCAEQAKGSSAVFTSAWQGVIHHTADQHTWTLGHGGGEPNCSHGPLEGEERWLEAGSTPHKTLTEVVLDKTFLKNSSRYTNFRHTGDLEVFHHHLLMYAGKRFAFEYPAYEARCLLAAIDFQKHKDRLQRKRKDGTKMWKRVYNKRSENWFVTPVRVPKTYNYIEELQAKVLQRRFADKGSIKRKVPIAEDDGRRIAKTIKPVSPPTMQELYNNHQSRYAGNKSN